VYLFPNLRESRGNIGYHLGSSNTREHLVEQRVAYFTEDSSFDTLPTSHAQSDAKCAGQRMPTEPL
jgi:hypothetical protein